MTRLEEIEAFLRKEESSPARYTTLRTNDLRDLLYALDCYKARVAVLENCLEHYAHDNNWFHGKDGGCWLGLLKDGEQANDYAASVLALSPEECLERQKGVG